MECRDIRRALQELTKEDSSGWASVFSVASQSPTRSGGQKCPASARSTFPGHSPSQAITLAILLGTQIYALNRVMTELEQQQFDTFCKQMQASGE